jgi:hypothetical protein
MSFYTSEMTPSVPEIKGKTTPPPQSPLPPPSVSNSACGFVVQLRGICCVLFVILSTGFGFLKNNLNYSVI